MAVPSHSRNAWALLPEKASLNAIARAFPQHQTQALDDLLPALYGVPRWRQGSPRDRLLSGACSSRHSLRPSIKDEATAPVQWHIFRIKRQDEQIL